MCGCAIKPKTGKLFLIRAKFTVKFGLLLINSFVPSIGSTNQKILLFFRELCDFLNSSLTISISGNSFFNPSTAILLTSKSAFVKGE